MTAKSDSTPYGVIYCVTNKVNGKKYIGQTTMSITRRWAAHCNEHSGCRSMAGAIKKYGRESFEVQQIAQAPTRDLLNAIEITLIAEHKTHKRTYGYNLSLGGLSDKPSVESKALMAIAKIGKKATAETRKKMSDAKIGRAPGRLAVENSILANAGRALTAEHRKKLSEAHIGRKLPAHVIAKMVAKNTGKKRTDETREKISAALTGKKRGPHSDEHKKKIGLAGLGRQHTPESKAKLSASHKGKVLTPEHRAKLSASRQAHFAAKKAAQI